MLGTSPMSESNVQAVGGDINYMRDVIAKTNAALAAYATGSLSIVAVSSIDPTLTQTFGTPSGKPWYIVFVAPRAATNVPSSPYLPVIPGPLTRWQPASVGVNTPAGSISGSVLTLVAGGSGWIGFGLYQA